MKRGLTGLPAWLVQRASAVYLLLFLIFVLASFALAPPHSRNEWLQWLAHPAMRLALAVFFAALLAHMWVGLRDVLLDYAQPVRIRPYLLAALAAALCGLGVWAVLILLRIPT
ncbi:succinate dehydrogenase, hydrophobic membrane anchor protein [Simplicispira suum]|uniref:succinate dehydrogenase, hydrophobic membrane anchor protein n=1 Tax=Simplicispira suum TaxID=2109915 RepID=UPI001474CDF4|nr:succinate dehydrogenase, hydrophobic membrane anchor protein [Simplicispira suum]MBW7833359.1 succinate dehydrogenase, hydrophobic membrane anchor protein [Simplicispira suum]